MGDRSANMMLKTLESNRAAVLALRAFPLSPVLSTLNKNPVSQRTIMQPSLILHVMLVPLNLLIMR